MSIPIVWPRPSASLFSPLRMHRFTVDVEWLSDGAREDGLLLSGHLYDGSGRLLSYNLPRVDIPSGRVVVVDYDLEPLVPGRYMISFDLVTEHEHWLSDVGLPVNRCLFTVADEQRASDRRHSIYEVAPGNLALLAQDCFGRGDFERARILTGDALRERPDDADAWKLLSRQREREGDLPAAYDTHKLAVGLLGTRAATADRARVVDLAIAGGAISAIPPALPPTERPLHLVFAAITLDPPLGGAELTWLYLAASAQSRGHRVTLLTNGGAAEPFARAMEVHRHAEAVGAAADPAIASADVVLTQHDWAPDVVCAARTADRPVAVFVQSYELLCGRPWMLDRCHQGGCQCVAAEVARGRKALRRADIVLAASAYVADQVHRATGVRAEIFHQLVAPARAEQHADVPLKAIVMNQPDFHKGGEVFEALARRLPRETFVTVGRAERRSDALPNLFHLGQVEPRLLMSIIDILLVPSIWPEPFGRVALEAMMAGVPVVATRCGGLPEVLGDAALLVDDPADLEAWVAHIFRLKSHRELRAGLVVAGRRRATAFNARAEALRVLQCIEAVGAAGDRSHDRRC